MRVWIKDHPVKESRLQEGSVVKAILDREPKYKISFELHPNANPPSRKQGLLRWQINPEPFWGPRPRARVKEADKTCTDAKKEKNKKRKREKVSKSFFFFFFSFYLFDFFIFSSIRIIFFGSFRYKAILKQSEKNSMGFLLR